MPGWVDTLGDAVRGAIRAYHGSPHNFDRFDARKINTGEGAQAYGHGHYFAGSEDTGKFYRDSVKAPTEEERQLLQVIRRTSSRLMQERDNASTALEQLAKSEGTPAFGWGAIKDLPDTHAARKLKYDIERLQIAIDKSLAEEGALYGRVHSRPGHMYEVEIDAPEESLLDWDASVHDQNMNAQAVFGNVRDQLFWPGAKAKYAGAYLDSDEAIRWNQAVMTGRPKGMDLWHAASVLEGPDSAAQFLASQGIPGIRYLDQGSRSAGEGTRNYVMFPGTEDSISILRKYGLLPATLGAEGLVNQQQPGE
jgi:hypothetical protein